MKETTNYYELFKKNIEKGNEIRKEFLGIKEVQQEEKIKEGKLSYREVARKVHEETKQSYMREYGKYMNPEQIRRMESEKTLEKLNVITPEEYINRFPGVDLNVLGHCDKEGNIFVKAVSDNYVIHTVTHETTHLSSDREISENDKGVTSIVSGFRETVHEGKRKLSDYNMGINEGITEMYTLRELERRGETEAAMCVKSYSEARVWGERLESLLGSDLVSAAYFGKNKESLESEFNRLNNDDEGAWKEFSADIDVITYGRNLGEIDAARERLQEKYKTMYLNKYFFDKERRE